MAALQEAGVPFRENEVFSKHTSMGVGGPAAVMAFPLMVRSVRIAFELVDPGLEAAARTLGASRARVFA